MRSSHTKKPRGVARTAKRVPLGTPVVRPEPERERAFLVGLEVRTRGRSGAKGTVTAQASAARDAAAMPTAKAESAAKSGKPSIPARSCSGAIGPILRP